MKAELDELLALLDQRFGVDSLWVFGSQAAGRAREDSDLDVAVLFEERPSAVELVELASEAEAIIGRPVDIVDLDAASPLLAFQALRHGRLLVDRNVSRRIRFSAALPGRREDLLRVRRPIEERLAARLGRGAGGG